MTSNCTEQSGTQAERYCLLGIRRRDRRRAAAVLSLIVPLPQLTEAVDSLTGSCQGFRIVEVGELHTGDPRIAAFCSEELDAVLVSGHIVFCKSGDFASLPRGVEQLQLWLGSL